MESPSSSPKLHLSTWCDAGKANFGRPWLFASATSTPPPSSLLQRMDISVTSSDVHSSPRLMDQLFSLDASVGALNNTATQHARLK